MRCPQQSGFTGGRSTTDAILTLRLLADLHRQFHKPLYVAYVDFKAAFDSVDRSALWAALNHAGLPEPIAELIMEIHKDSVSQVSVAGNISATFPTLSGVRQGCLLVPSLFCLVIDKILQEAGFPSINLKNHQFADLAYAVDVAIVDHLLQSLASSLDQLQWFVELSILVSQ